MSDKHALLSEQRAIGHAWSGAAELRTYCLNAVLAVLLGTGIGVAGHYFADSAGVRAVASAATPPTQNDAVTPPLSNLSAQREGPALRSSDAQQPARSMLLGLSDEEKLTLVTLLTRSIVNDRHPLSLRVRTFKDILTKLDVNPPVQPSPRRRRAHREPPQPKDAEAVERTAR
jgi:hypothetical protein